VHPTTDRYSNPVLWEEKPEAVVPGVQFQSLSPCGVADIFLDFLVSRLLSSYF
jgi:hypothetical protein